MRRWVWRRPVSRYSAAAINKYYLLFGKSFFGGWEGFVEALRYSFTPDIVSLFRGEFGEDRWQSMKLGFFVLLCVGTVAAEYFGIMSFFR